MSQSAANGASLVAAAVQAAIRERAPRRTVAAVAAAVAGTVLSSTARVPATVPDVRAPSAQSNDVCSDDPALLLEKLRSVRRAQRQRKKQKRREAKQAAVDSPTSEVPPQHVNAEDPIASTAGLCTEMGASLVAAPALVLTESPGPDTPTRPRGLTLQQLPARQAEIEHDDEISQRSFAPSSLRSSPAPTLCSQASERASAGMPPPGQSAAQRPSPYSKGQPRSRGK